MLQDLISKRAFPLAQIVYSEKLREKFEITAGDNIIGMRIFSAQKKLPEFTDLYNKILNMSEKEGDEASKVTLEMFEQVSTDLVQFNNEKEKMQRLEMTEKLEKKIIDLGLDLTGKTIDSCVYVYTET